MVTPPSEAQNFLIPEVSDTLKGCPTKFLGTVRQENFNGKSWRPLPPTHPNFFDTRNYWKNKMFPYGTFGTVKQQIFEGDLDTPPSLLSLNFFATRYFLKHSRERFLNELFRYCETEKSTEKRDITLLSIKFFNTRYQWHPRWFTYKNFRNRETKNFWRKILILPPSYP